MTSQLSILETNGMQSPSIDFVIYIDIPDIEGKNNLQITYLDVVLLFRPLDLWTLSDVKWSMSLLFTIPNDVLSRGQQNESHRTNHQN